MIILTDKMLVIPVGISPNYAGAGKSDIKIQDSKDVTITENGSTTVVPDENFDVLTKVNITTDVNPALEDKSVEITENGDYNYTASAPYYGIGNFNVKVNVQWPVESSKTVNPSFNEDITVLPSEGFDAMSSVIVKKAVPNLEDKNVEINENGDYSFSKSAPYDGIGNFNVKVNVQLPVAVESSKTVNPSFIEDVTVTPSEGFDAMSSVIVKKAVANLQDKTVDKASTSQIVLTADEGYQGLGTVTVAPIKTTTHTVIPSSNQQLITADTNNNEYISEVIVNGVPQKTLTADPSTNEQTFNSNHSSGEFYSRVVVNPVTSSIDSNIVPRNIAKGVSILGVTGTLETSSGDAPLPSELQEIINKGPAYSSKIKVYGVYVEDKSTAYNAQNDNFTNDAGIGGYIPFFQKNVKYDNGYPSNDTLANSLGTLADRGIVAYTVNGVLYTNPTSFNIPYTKVNSGNRYYDDVTVDVYIDFTKANARAKIIENAFLSDNGITTPVDSSLFDVNTYRYLPPIFNSNKKEYYFKSGFNPQIKIYELTETYVREQVNALSALFMSGDNSSAATGEITFLTGKDGIKRVPDALSERDFTRFNNITFYGNVNDFKNIKNWCSKRQEFCVYGNVNGYDGIFQESSGYFFGNVSTPTRYFKCYKGDFLDQSYNSNIIDIAENVDANPTRWNGSSITACNVAFFPKTLKYLYDNYVMYSSMHHPYYGSYCYVFFGTTPPTMPDVDGNPQLLLQKPGSTNIENHFLDTIYKPAGADYSSILDPTNPPTVIDFTPITSMSEVTGPGIYGLTYGDKGYHWLFEITEPSQDLQTIANELNNL